MSNKWNVDYKGHNLEQLVNSKYRVWKFNVNDILVFFFLVLIV